MNQEKLRPPKELSREDKELFDLLSPARNIDIKIQKLFEEMPKNFVLLLLEQIKEIEPQINGGHFHPFGPQTHMGNHHMTFPAPENPRIARFLFNEHETPVEKILEVDFIEHLVKKRNGIH